VNKIEHIDLFKIVSEHFDFVCSALKKRTKHSCYRKGSVKRKLELLLVGKYKTGRGRPLIKYLDTNVDTILKGDPFQLATHIKAIKKIINDRGLNFKSKSALFDDIKKCFDYEAYVKKKIPYEILAKLAVNACPYCNRQFINTYNSDEGKSRATLDHFYAKSEYPYLAISFFNLIPSCYSCNSSIKRSKKFHIKSHLHPFLSDFENEIAFTIGFKRKRVAKANREKSEKYIAAFYSNANLLTIGFRQIRARVTPEAKKAFKNIEDLRLEDLYAFHKDYVIELLQKSIVYGKSGYAKTLSTQFPKIFKNEHDVLKLVLGNYVSVGTFNKRPFSRMTRDISAELGLLDLIQ
jgi:hypothetical protein